MITLMHIALGMTAEPCTAVDDGDWWLGGLHIDRSPQAALQLRAFPLTQHQPWDCCWFVSIITNDSALSKANEVTHNYLLASGKCSFTEGWKSLIVSPPSHLMAKKWGVSSPHQQPLALFWALGKETACKG